MPMPISWLPSRVARGVGLRRDQPNASPPCRKQSVSRRVENGRFVGEIAVGFVAQPQLDRIHAQPEREVVHGRLQREGTGRGARARA